MSLRAFATGALDDFRTTAAVAPSSRYLVQAMLEPLPLARARTVVELGPGTGVMTQTLLDLLPENATLLAFEINSRFFHYLKEKFSDPRLVLIPASAETLGSELRRRGCKRLDAAVSSLGLTFMSEAQQHAVLRGLVTFLDRESVFTQYHYLHGVVARFQFEERRVRRFSAARLLREYFRRVERKVVWRNVPPAFVFTCRC